MPWSIPLLAALITLDNVPVLSIRPFILAFNYHLKKEFSIKFYLFFFSLFKALDKISSASFTITGGRKTRLAMRVNLALRMATIF